MLYKSKKKNIYKHLQHLHLYYLTMKTIHKFCKWFELLNSTFVYEPELIPLNNKISNF